MATAMFAPAVITPPPSPALPRPPIPAPPSAATLLKYWMDRMTHLFPIDTLPPVFTAATFRLVRAYDPRREPTPAILAAAFWLVYKLLGVQFTMPRAQHMQLLTGIPRTYIVRAELDICRRLSWNLWRIVKPDHEVIDATRDTEPMCIDSIA